MVRRFVETAAVSTYLCQLDMGHAIHSCITPKKTQFTSNGKLAPPPICLHAGRHKMNKEASSQELHQAVQNCFEDQHASLQHNVRTSVEELHPSQEEDYIHVVVSFYLGCGLLPLQSIICLHQALPLQVPRASFIPFICQSQKCQNKYVHRCLCVQQRQHCKFSCTVMQDLESFRAQWRDVKAPRGAPQLTRKDENQVPQTQGEHRCFSHAKCFAAWNIATCMFPAHHCDVASCQPG